MVADSLTAPYSLHACTNVGLNDGVAQRRECSFLAKCQIKPAITAPQLYSTRPRNVPVHVWGELGVGMMHDVMATFHPASPQNSACSRDRSLGY
jgi:hypothetical protein